MLERSFSRPDMRVLEYSANVQVNETDVTIIDETKHGYILFQNTLRDEYLMEFQPSIGRWVLVC